MPDKSKLAAVILAGGLSRRMHGEDKGLCQLNAMALIDFVIRAIDSQVDTILISANQNTSEYERRGYPVIEDSIAGNKGPLAGILSAMQAQPDMDFLFVIPCDMPIIPQNLVDQLFNKLILDQADICCVKTAHRLQPLLSVIKTSTHTSLSDYLDNGRHKVIDWVESLNYTYIEIDSQPLFNLNTPEDLYLFQKYLTN